MIKKTEKHLSYSGICLNDLGTKSIINKYKKYEKRELLDIENLVVIIAQDNIDNIKEMVEYLRKNNILYDHIANYEMEISLKLLNTLGYKDYIDYLGNHIRFESINKNSNIIIKKMGVFAHDNIIDFGKVSTTAGINISLFGSNGYIKIGNSSCFQAIFQISTEGRIEIGDDCMISRDVNISQPDQHLIFDLATKERININKNIKIGNHVWIGRSAQILGGAQIPDNSIVGACAVTSGKFFESNCIIAGNPAEVIRKNIIWARDSQMNNFHFYDECDDLTALKYLDEIHKQIFIALDNENQLEAGNVSIERNRMGSDK